MNKKTLSAYYRLTKPGVLYGNVLTAAAGFLFASGRSLDVGLFVATITGTTLVIASACVINNYLDQDIDQLMERTKVRPLITGEVSGRGAVVFSVILGILGVLILQAFTNTLVVVIGIAGFVTYVLLYGMLSKRMSLHGTLVGSVSGAAPILAGYVAVTGRIDVAAALLFAVLFIWQMPEFYSIAVFRYKEYKAAGVPVITVAKGIAHTKWQIMLYIVAFTIAVVSLALAGFAGKIYLLSMTTLCLYWLWLGNAGFKASDDNAWARRVFRHSLVILLAFSLLISIDAWLP